MCSENFYQIKYRKKLIFEDKILRKINFFLSGVIKSYAIYDGADILLCTTQSNRYMVDKTMSKFLVFFIFEYLKQFSV